jgi:FPC/CPF motif-containing protein YcgG
MNANCNIDDWRRRIILGTSIGDDRLPAWLMDAYATYHTNIVDRGYPCYFGSQAERNGALYYSYVSGAQIDHLPATLQTFLGVCANISRDKNNLVVFFEPDTSPATHSQHRAAFWDTLQYLRAHDPTPSSLSYQIDPSDPFWEFPFAGSLFFVIGISPSYRFHRSRNLGPCMMMVFQPREVFQDSTTANEISAGARNIIRNRVHLWDGIPAHPDLNIYGHPGNLEWIQYFISDDNSRETGRCPLSHGARASDGANGRQDAPRSERKP